MRRIHGSILAGSLAVLVIGASNCSSDSQARSELVTLRNALTPSTTRPELERLVTASKTLFLSKSGEPKEWSVGTPLRWDARNWVLWIEFREDRISTLKIRLYDSRTMHPEEAPPDLVFGSPPPAPR